MSRPTTVKLLEELGRVRLSNSFFMRDFLYSEISQVENIANTPEHPDIAIAAGMQLCELLLEPLQARFGRIAIRSAYRSPAVNAKGAENGNQYSCAANSSNFAKHIWDYPDSDGYIGATVCIVVPAILPWYERTGDWTPLAWWIHENLPYSSQYWFPKLAAFNLGWRANPTVKQSIQTYVENPNTKDKKALVKDGIATLEPRQRRDIIASWIDSF